eukprot:tig00021537_g22326.t1
MYEQGEGSAAGHVFRRASVSSARHGYARMQLRELELQVEEVRAASTHAPVHPIGADSYCAPRARRGSGSGGDGEGDSIRLGEALKALHKERENVRRYGALAAFGVFYAIYLVVLFLQRDTRAAWEVQSSITRDIEAAGLAEVKDPPDFLAWLEGPFRDLALRGSGGTVARHNRLIVQPLILQERHAPERCKGQPRFDRVYPECFTGPTIVEPRPPALDLDYADPVNAAAGNQLLRITRTMFDLPGEKLPDPAEAKQEKVSEAASPSNRTAGAEEGPAPTREEAFYAAFMLGLAEDITRAGRDSGSFAGVEIIGALDALNGTRATFLADVELVRFLGFVGRNTRSISVKFAAYNGHVRMASVAEAKIEAAYTGSVAPSVSVNVFRAELYSQPLDWFRLALEIVVVLGVAVRLVATARDLLRQRCKASKTFRRGALKALLVGLADQLVFAAAIGLWGAVVAATSSLPSPRPDVGQSGSTDEGIQAIGRLYRDCDRAASLFRAYHVVSSINIFLGLLRLYGLLHFQDRMGVLTRTLARGATDMMHLGALILVTLIVRAFAFCV